MGNTFTITQTYTGTLTETFTPSIDGDVFEEYDTPPTVYTKDTTDNLIRAYAADRSSSPSTTFRGFIEWDISPLPNTTTVSTAKLLYHGGYNSGDCHIHEMLGYRPSTSSSNSALYAECGEGTIYADVAGFPVVAENQILDISTASTDITNQLSSGWFAIGIQNDDETDWEPYPDGSLIFSDDNASANPKPSLYVEYSGDVASTCTLNQPATITHGYIRKTESFLFPDGTFKRHDVGSGGKTITMNGTETSSATSNFNTLETMAARGIYITLSGMNNSDLDTDWFITNFNWYQKEGYVDRYDYTMTLKEVG